jgi:ABC-2 type transport system permease protein
MKMLTMTEAKLLVREPLALFWGLAFPMALLAVMGLSSSDIGGVPLVTIYEPIVIAFVGVVFGVQGIPVQVAGYRERRILRRLATTPAGPGTCPASVLACRPGSSGWGAWPIWIGRSPSARKRWLPPRPTIPTVRCT